MTKRLYIYSDLLVVLILTIGAYITSALAPLLSLDDMSILNILGSSELNYFSLFFGGAGDYFRPLTFVSFLLDLTLFGNSSRAFHLVNLAIHCANALLVYYLAHLIIPTEETQNSRAPFVASLLFALHPINTEAVMWIAARTDLICCFFFLLALIVVVEQKQGFFRSAVAVFILALLSLLAKESSVGLVGILLVWWLSLYRDERGRRALWMAISAGCATVVYLMMRSGMQIRTDSGVGKVLASGAGKPLWQLIYDSAAAFGFYSSKAFYPFPLNFAIVTINKPLSVVIFICSLAACIVLFIRSPRMRLPLLIFTILLVPPVLALHGKLPWTPYAERYLYLSMTGFVLVVAFFVSKLPYRAYLVVVTLIMLLSIPTMQRVILWGNPMRFWSDVMQKSPEFPRSYAAVAIEKLQDKKYDEAEILLNKSLQMGVNTDYIWQGLAMARLGKDDLPGYESAMLRTAALSANSTLKFISLIQTVSKRSNDVGGQYRIIGYYIMANQRDPRYGDGLYNAGKVYRHLGETENALIYFKKFLDSPGDSMYVPFAKGAIQKINAQTSNRN